MEAASLSSGLTLTNRNGQSANSDRIRLLQAIAAHGSISAAARAVGLSYKGAWEGVNAMNNLFDRPLVSRNVGGSGGGGATLTEAGHHLVDSYLRYQKALDHALAELQSLYRLPGGPAPINPHHLTGTLSMKTSARNQFFGRVNRIDHGAVNAEIVIDIGPDLSLTAMVTRQSALDLALAPGREVYALIKSSSPILISDSEGCHYSARNLLRGSVLDVSPGAVNAEVTLDLGEGKTLVTIVTQESLHTLGVTPGEPLAALVKASQIILMTHD